MAEIVIKCVELLKEHENISLQISFEEKKIMINIKETWKKMKILCV
jgi:hypothetical protein